MTPQTSGSSAGASATTNSTSATLHPYYPLGVQITSYIPNQWPEHIMLSVFSSICITLFIGTLTLLKYAAPRLPGREKATVWWFVLCGFLHCFFEGYFVVNNADMGPKQDVFGQLWKVYALSDSRYLISDPLVLCMEGLTAIIWGPLCFLAAIFIIRNSPLRHPIQLIVCVGHIYGLLLYYSTSLYERYILDKSYSRPEVLYFWGYYLGLNALWFVVPVLLMRSSLKKIARAFTALEKVDATLRKGGVNARPRTPLGPKVGKIR